jgi:exopolysaccharide biosynthesis polyprenyl glycosylphosphotransferase
MSGFLAALDSRYGRWVMAAVDLVLVGLAFVGGYYLRYEAQLLRVVAEAYYAPFQPYIPYTIFFIAWVQLSYWSAHLYERQRGRSWLDEMYIIINGVTNATVVTMALSFLFQPLVFSRLLLLEAAGLAVIFLGAARLVQRQLQAALRARGVGVERVLIVGAGKIGRSVMQAIVARPDLGYQAVGFVDDDPERSSADMGRVRALGRVDDLPELLRRETVDVVIVTLPWRRYPKILDAVSQCARQNIPARVVPDLFQLSLSQVQVETLDGVPLLSIGGERTLPRSSRLAKRMLDLTLVLIAAPIVLVLMAVVGLAIRLEGPGSVFFRQRRVGQGGRPFEMLKFRSMIEGAEEQKVELVAYNEAVGPLFKMKRDPRVTRVGRLIRRFSLDELPQIINVLRGEMSWVGPRPGLAEEVARYEPWQHQRLEAPPGITGLWQVSGRSDMAFEEMCLLDIYYIENWSLGLDLRILARTVPHVLLGNGAY